MLATLLTMPVVVVLRLMVVMVVHPLVLLMDRHMVACLVVVTMVRAMVVTTPTDPSVRSVAKLATPHASAGITWLKVIQRILIQLLWLPHLHTRLIPTGIVIWGATYHITSDLDRLAIHEKYHGSDTVQVSNGAGLQILHLGSCSINTNTRPLALNNVLRVPEISKHLLSIHKLVCDNNIFFKFHPW
jgi:hypothetical protein